MSMPIGMNYENWVTNKANFEKLQKGKDSTFQYSTTGKTVPLSAFELAESRINQFDANKNGGMDYNEYSLKEIVFGRYILFAAEKAEYFSLLDTNKDGLINPEELAVETMLADFLDGKLDGQMSFDKTRQMLLNYKQLTPAAINGFKNYNFPEMQGQRYQEWYSNNGSNYIDGKETGSYKYAYMDGLDRKNKIGAVLQFAKSRIDFMDKNGDSKLDKNEFYGGKQGMFEALDLNKDGFVDKNEMAAGMAYMDSYDGDNSLNGEINFAEINSINWNNPNATESVGRFKTLFPDNPFTL
ncbi:hypothetical protein IJE86_04180 [bacterium]|nr:hypothetical protein [bacterium]